MVCPIALCQNRRDTLIMKYKLLLCGVALFVAGCDTPPQNPFATSSDYSFSYDVLPQPVPDITPVDLDKLYLISPTGYVETAPNPARRGASYDIDR